MLIFFLISMYLNSKSSFNMPPRKRKTQSKSAGKQSAIVRRTPLEVEDDTNNDETNRNESLNQEESLIINNDTSFSAPPNPSSVIQAALGSEASKLDAVDKSSQNASINNEEEDNNMDIDENQ